MSVQIPDISDARRFKIALLEPRIPPNTGNISRACVATGSELHVAGKTGFNFSDREVRRAGLDYWKNLIFRQYDSVQDFMDTIADQRFWLFTTKTDCPYYRTRFEYGDYFIFGSEVTGIDEAILNRYPERCLTIPMVKDHVRSLNLSNAVSIVLYEALRQQNFNLKPLPDNGSDSNENSHP